jgi:hypothetical protein
MSENCAHEMTKRGANITRRWGSYRSQVCTGCGAFRATDHYDNPRGSWQPASGYADAIADEEMD